MIFRDLENYEEPENESDSSTENKNKEKVDSKRKVSENEGKMNKKARKDLYKQPTTDELNQLKETENLYSSSLMRLQIEELLGKINVSKRYINKVEDFWNEFKEVMENFNDLVDHKRIFKIDSLDIKCDKEFNLNDIEFIKPEKYKLFGLYKLECITNKKDEFNVNINISIPTKFFQEKDYLNNRYLVKRDFYIQYLFAGFKKVENWNKYDFCINYYKKLKYSPYICIKHLNNIKINVFLTAEANTFKLRRVVPDMNNMKIDFDKNFVSVNVKDYENVPTLFYNSILARDLTLNENYDWLESKINSKNVQDGLKLALIWLNLRELNDCFNGFNYEIVLFLVGYLIEKKKINENMSSYQIVRIFWYFLINSDWSKEPIYIRNDSLENFSENLNLFKNNYDVVFLDKTGFFNLTSFLDLDNYQTIRNEAKRALEILDSNNFNSFSYLFNTKISFLLQFDAVVKINNFNLDVIFKKTNAPEKWKYYGFYDYLITKKIKDLLKKALNHRVFHITPKIFYDFNNKLQMILIGIVLNPEKAFNTIEKGPSEENPIEVKEFKEFWGKFSDFRRFQDSTAAEVAVFPRKTIQDRRNIYATIINYVLEEKYGLNIELIGNQFEEFVADTFRKPSFPSGTNEEACLKVKHIFDDLSEKMRNLKLELTINSIQGVSPVFCYTHLFPPISTNYQCDEKITTHLDQNVIFNNVKELKAVPKYVYPIECVIKLSRSSAWPNEIEALRAIKCEFYLKISSLLNEELKNKIITQPNFDCLQVFYEGLVFRFKLFIEKELILLKKSINSEGAVIYQETEECFELEKNSQILPKIISALNGIHQENPSFGSCSTLIKRWLRSQMIDDDHMSDIIIDLWNASLYINQNSFNKFNLPQIGFIRFLKHVASFDPKTDFILVNFNEDIEKSRLDEIESNFINNRSSLPFLYIVTPYDNGKSIFSKRGPSEEILRRISILAEAAYTYLNDISIKWKKFEIKNLFQPSLEGYDLIINLVSHLNPLKYQQIPFKNVNKSVDIENYDRNVSKFFPIIDFNPIQKFLKELRVIYGKYALFFHDSYGGETIGVLWIKSELEPKEFKIGNVNCKKKVGDKLVLNREAIIEDIYNRGMGLIKSIEKA
ncbi:nucleolar protein 6 [Onthophagus taurus]|uniref:nucleolar protein 6 n=1 Tax=Onthophagus taurus TaxID=166361 RepID=UPI0039BE011A